MSNLIPATYNNERILTTEQLAQVYETESRRITENFNRNKERFVKGRHYYLLQGEELRAFKREYADSVVATISKLYLWTERGADRHCKILDTDKAWEQFDHLEETYFRAKENKIDTQQLSPETQLILRLSESIARNELANKQIQAKISVVEENVQAIRDIIVINPKAEWRKQTNYILNSIGFKTKEYQGIKEDAYKALEERGKCKLKIRLDNLKGRALRQGMAPSKADKLNYLDVIENDVKLKEIYIAIVKEIAIKNGIKVKEDVAV